MEQVSIELETQEAEQIAMYLSNVAKASEQLLDAGCMLDGLKWRLATKYGHSIPQQSMPVLEGNKLHIFYQGQEETINEAGE